MAPELPGADAIDNDFQNTEREGQTDRQYCGGFLPERAPTPANLKTINNVSRVT